MAYFRIDEPNKPTKYIKNVDGANTTLEFTDTTDGAFFKDEGFFADSEKEFLMFHFKEKYPELQYMTIYNGYKYEMEMPHAVQEGVAAAPQMEEVDAVGW
jgi:hypothetical protein